MCKLGGGAGGEGEKSSSRLLVSREPQAVWILGTGDRDWNHKQELDAPVVINYYHAGNHS